MDAAIEKFKNGNLSVFDTAKFTVTPAAGATNITVDADGHVTSYKADVDDMGDYVGETEVIESGVFKESKFSSAPYFYLRIDGITEITK